MASVKWVSTGVAITTPSIVSSASTSAKSVDEPGTGQLAGHPLQAALVGVAQHRELAALDERQVSGEVRTPVAEADLGESDGHAGKARTVSAT